MLLVVLVTGFLNPFNVTAVNVSLPLIGRSLAVDAVLLGWVTTAYLMATVVLIVPGGRLADMYGRKRAFVGGVSVYMLASALSALAPNVWALIVCRMLQGTGNAMVAGTGMALLAEVYPPAQRGLPLGLWVTAVYSGQSMGPFLGGAMAQHFGWRAVFVFSFAAGMVIVAISLIGLRAGATRRAGERFDRAGALLWALLIVTLMSGLAQIPDARGFLLALAGLAALATFVWWELRAEHPLLEMGLFLHNRMFALSNLASLLAYSATFAVSFLLSLYLQVVKGLPPQAAGLVLLAQPVMQAVVSPFAGRLSDRLEPRFMAGGGMLGITGGLYLLSTLGRDTPLGLVVGVLLAQGLGFGCFSSPNQNAIINSVTERHYGVASSVTAAGRVAGQLLSMAAVSSIFAVVAGRVQLAPEQAGALLRASHDAFLLFAALCLASVMASLARGNVRDARGNVRDARARRDAAHPSSQAR